MRCVRRAAIVENQDLTPFLVAGASGLVGRAIVERVMADGRGPGVVAVVRRPLGIAGPRVTEVVADFSRKGRTATLRDVEVIAAAREAGLVDNKVASFSETHTSLRLVIPVHRRPPKS